MFVDRVQFARQAWQNRNYIKSQHGRLLLTVPVRQHARSESINAKTIDTSQPWRVRHHRSIVNAYAAAPFIDDYRPFLRDVYAFEWSSLRDLNLSVTVRLAQLFGITTPWLCSGDLRPVRGTKTDMIVELCRQIGATAYLSGDGATYFDEQRFHEAGIELQRQCFVHPRYRQQHTNHGFIPNLAALDLLFNEGADGLGLLRSANAAQRCDVEKRRTS